VTDNKQQFKTSGKKLPDSNAQANMADWIMTDPARHAVTYRYLGKGSKPDLNIHYIVRHKDVMDVLKDRHLGDVDLDQYDTLMASATKGLDIHPQQFLLGAHNALKEQRWELLQKAMNHPPRMDRRKMRVFDDMAARAVNKALEVVKTETGKKGSFNAIRDYGYYVACLAGLELTGMSLPKKPTLILHVATFFRNRGKEHKVKLTENMSPPNLALLWSQAIFGQTFGNVDDRSGLLRFAARKFSKAFLKQIAFCMSDDYHAPAGSLIDRFKSIRSDFPDMDDALFAHHVAGVVYEFVGTVIILAGTSFGNLLASIDEYGMTIPEFIERLGDPSQHAIDEALRLNPTSGQLYRTVKKDFNLHGTQIKAGDLICCILARTMRDPDVFPDPDQFSDFKPGSPKRDILDYLNFGPNEATPNAFTPADGRHPCFGQYWARGLLEKMLVGLTGLKDLRPTGKLTRFMGQSLPDAYPMQFTPPLPGPAKEAGQNLYTVCSEIRCPPEQRPQIEQNVLELIKELGNPGDEDMRRRLLATGCIHFMSMNVIKGETSKEPSYLVLEMSADGDEDQVLAKICEHAGDRFYKIYEKSGNVKKPSDLLPHMRNHAVELTQSVWPEFFSGKRRNGLGFNGTGGLTSKRIRAEQTLVAFARNEIAKVDETGAGTSDKTPQQILSAVRGSLSDPELEKSNPDVAASKWVLENSVPPIYAEKSDSEWLLAGGGMASTIAKMFPRPIAVYFGVFYLLVAALISLFLFGGNTGPTALCAQIPGCNGNLLMENPIDLGAMPKSDGPHYLFNNPANIGFGFIAAFIFSVLISTAFALWRRLTGGFYRYGFNQIGAIFWLVLGLVFIVGLQTLNPFLPPDWQIPLFDRKGMEIFYMRPEYWIGITTSTIVVIFYLLVTNRLRFDQILAVTSAAFLMIAAVVFVTQHQIKIMKIGNDPEGNSYVLNRFGDAGLDHLIFYPFLMGLLIVMAIYAFNLSFPKLNRFREMRHYMTIFAGAFLFVFVTSFFSWTDVIALKNNAQPILKEWVLFPLFAGLILLCAYYAYNHYLIRRKFTYKKFFSVLIMVGAVLSLLWHLPQWATQAVGEHLLSFVLAIPTALILIGMYLALLYILITRSEKANTPHDTETQTELVGEMMRNENQEAAQNHMTSVVGLIPSQFRRRFTLPLALSIVLQGLKANRNRPGFLGSIGTVHYARWIHLPKTNNYVFYSNYDGSFENYLEDFITKASFGLTGVWSHSVGFPKTKLLFFGGSEDGDRFKRYARGSMIPTPFWFSAYPSVSAEQIRRNALIRDGIARIDSPSDAEAWLDLFGSISRPEHVIEDDRVQSIMFSGGGYLRSGACLVVQSKDGSSDKFRNWVGDVSPLITFGDVSPKNPCTYIAFGKDGLELLGLGNDLKHEDPWDGRNQLTGPPHRVKFAPAFCLGMDHETRQNILGDGGEDAPENWKWGSGEKRAHAVLMIYARDQAALKTLLNTHKKLLSKNGLGVKIISFEDIPKKGFGKEPFGFVDGVSQPILRGTRREARTGESIHLVNPGEFILGYKDERGYYPPSPQIGAHRDTEKDLPATVTEMPQRYPKFEPAGENTLRDLGRNGSFLVIRQLEQDAKGFKEVTGKIGQSLCPHDPEGAAEVIQAKMMGRWQDGRSLSDNPVRIKRNAAGELEFNYKRDLDPVSRPYNEFLFGKDDPQGHDCPFGSHIRRSYHQPPSHFAARTDLYRREQKRHVFCLPECRPRPPV